MLSLENIVVTIQGPQSSEESLFTLMLDKR